MRLTEQQKYKIKQLVTTLTGKKTKVILFGSRVDDEIKGGDIDLLIILEEKVEHPAELSAKISAQLIRQFHSRKVDILLSAPNLKTLPIHLIAQQNGITL